MRRIGILVLTALALGAGDGLADDAKVVKSTPAEGATVDPGETEIILEFGADMVQLAIAPDRVEGVAYPENKGAPYFKTPKILVLPVKLKADTEYGIAINRRNETFKTAGGDAVERFILRFKTGTDRGNIYGWTALEKKALQPGEVYLNVLVREGDTFGSSAVFRVVTTTRQVLQNAMGRSQSTTTTDFLANQVREDEVLEIKANKIAKQKRKYPKARIRTHLRIQPSSFPSPPQERDLPHAGKSYVITTTGKKVEIRSGGDKVPLAQQASVATDPFLPDLVPTERIVKVGETWKHSSRWLESIVKLGCQSMRVSEKRHTATMKLERVAEENGAKLAILKLAGTCTYEHPTLKKTGTFDFQGTVVVDLTNRRYAALKFTAGGKVAGPLNMLGNQGHTEVALQMSLEARWAYNRR